MNLRTGCASGGRDPAITAGADATGKGSRLRGCIAGFVLVKGGVDVEVKDP
jgi:hypothetical protein